MDCPCRAAGGERMCVVQAQNKPTAQRACRGYPFNRKCRLLVAALGGVAQVNPEHWTHRIEKRRVAHTCVFHVWGLRADVPRLQRMEPEEAYREAPLYTPQPCHAGSGDPAGIVEVEHFAITHMAKPVWWPSTKHFPRIRIWEGASERCKIPHVQSTCGAPALASAGSTMKRPGVEQGLCGPPGPKRKCRIRCPSASSFVPGVCQSRVLFHNSKIEKLKDSKFFPR